MGLYLDSGYLDFNYIDSLNVPFVIIVGGRGIGKTYGGLDMMMLKEEKFILMRRTWTQVQMVMQPDFSPFKILNKDKGYNVQPFMIPKTQIAAYYHADEDGNPIDESIGYLLALSTVANIRGFDATDVKHLIWDEFIKEAQERTTIKDEAMAFFNAYETMNRNRELQGLPPLKAWLFSNANDLGNPIMLSMGLIKKAETMKRKGQEISVDRKRGIALILPKDSPISEAKKDTALYRLTAGSEFANMAVNNEFANEDREQIQSRPIAEYRPVVKVGEVTVYAHKSKTEYYVSTHNTGSPTTYGCGENELRRFRRHYYWLWEQYLRNNIYYEDSLSQVLLTKYME